MFAVTVQTRKQLNESKAVFDRGVSYEPGRENPFNKYDRIVPGDATYYSIVLDDGENLGVATAVYKGLELTTGREFNTRIFESYRDIGIEFNPRFVGKNVVLFSI